MLTNPSNIEVGDLLKVRGQGVYYPYNTFTYRVTKIEHNKISLEIADVPDTDQFTLEL